MGDPTSSKLHPEPETSSPKKRQKRSTQTKVNGKGKDKEEQDDESATSWHWHTLTDSHSSDVPPVFSKDGNYFFSVAGSSIKISSVATGELVSTLTLPKAPPVSDPSDSTLTCLALNPHNAFQLIVGSRNGHITIWDYMDAVLLRTIHLGQPIHNLVAHITLHDSLFVAVSKPRKNKQTDDSYSVLKVSLVAGPSSVGLDHPTPSETIAVGKTRLPTGLALSENGSWLVATAGHKVYVAATSSLQDGFVKYVSPERLTCLAFHPYEEYFATGDSKGVVRLWYCLNEQIAVQMKAVGVEKKSQTSAFHWHAHAVSSLSFSGDGGHLFSGGEEAVLVVWQLQTGRKEFVPRVGAPIKTISTLQVEDGEEALLSLADATNVFVKTASRKILRSFSKIKLEYSTDYGSSRTPLESPLAYHHLTSTLILSSSHPSSLQSFSLPSRKLVAELEVSPSNRVSRRDEAPLEPARVEQAVISESGEWLATIDTRRGDATFRAESYLKLWWWDSSSTTWTLNTRIDRPHGLKQIRAVAFSPVSESFPLQLATTGSDGKVRTWRIRTTKDKIGKPEDFWIARATLNLRSEVPLHASWSPDGSILAVTYTSIVALYDSQSCNVRANLCSPDFEAPHASHFLGHRYLIIHGKKWVSLWDVLSRAVVWHHKARQTIDRVIPHPRGTSFIVLHVPFTSDDTTRTRISRFSSSSSTPTAIHSLPFGLRSIISPPSSGSGFSLAAVTKSWSIAVIGDDLTAAEDEGKGARSISSFSLPQSRPLFQDIFGQSAFVAHPAPSSSSLDPAIANKPASLSAVFDGPAYLMPPLESFFEPLVGSRLRTIPLGVAPPCNTDIAESEDEDVVMKEPEPLPQPPQSTARTLSTQEFETFVDLFARHTLQKTPRPHAQTNGNGKHKSNGVSKTNGKHAPTTSKVLASQARASPAPAQQLLSPSPSPEPTLEVTGKKRKKTT